MKHDLRSMAGVGAAALVDTAMVPDDDSPDMTDDGYAAVSPRFDYDQMLEAVEDPDASEPQAELPPQEAYELAQFEAPLSEKERQILNNTPFLNPAGGLSWVDDPDHVEWLIKRTKDKRKAMDEVLEDEMYGAPLDHVARLASMAGRLRLGASATGDEPSALLAEGHAKRLAREEAQRAGEEQILAEGRARRAARDEAQRQQLEAAHAQRAAADDAGRSRVAAMGGSPFFSQLAGGLRRDRIRGAFDARRTRTREALKVTLAGDVIGGLRIMQGVSASADSTRSSSSSSRRVGGRPLIRRGG